MFISNWPTTIRRRKAGCPFKWLCRHRTIIVIVMIILTLLMACVCNLYGCQLLSINYIPIQLICICHSKVPHVWFDCVFIHLFICSFPFDEFIVRTSIRMFSQFHKFNFPLSKNNFFLFENRQLNLHHLLRFHSIAMDIIFLYAGFKRM